MQVKGALAALIALTMSAGSVVPVTSAAPATAQSGEPWQAIEVEDGADPAGGQHAFLKFGKWDAAFGVAWGDSASPGAIRVIGMQSRYLGLADAYDKDGNKVSGDIPVRVFTIHATRLESILEFDDKNGNGIADFVRTGNDTIDYRESDPVFKGVNLHTAWNVTKREVVDDTANKTRHYTLGLAATDLPYRSPVPVNGTLDRVEFTFHLRATMRFVNNASVPHFDMTVEMGSDGRRHVTDANYTGRVTASGRIGDYGVKWDHLIEGWDYSPRNQKPGLVMETHAIMANMVPPMTIELGRALAQMSADRGTYETPTGEQIVTESGAGTSWPDRLPSPLRTPRIHWMDQWSRVGRLTWVTDVDVDGRQGSMYAQVQGARRVMERGPNGGVFYGIGLLVGFSYPGGQAIFHDPTMDSSMLVVEGTGVCAPPVCREIQVGPVRIPLWLTLLVAISAVLFLSTLMYAKHRGLGPFHYRYEEALDRRERARANDWSRAYDEKPK